MRSKKLIIWMLMLCFIVNIQVCFAEDEEYVDEEAAAVTDRYISVIYNYIMRTSSVGSDWASGISNCIVAYSYKYGINPLLPAAMFAQESRFNMSAVSRAGAVGIVQMMPDTANSIGVKPYDPNQNLEGGIYYLARQLNRFSWAGDYAATYAVAAYNAGPGAIEKYGGIPPYSETIDYVNCVVENYNELLYDFNNM